MALTLNMDFAVLLGDRRINIYKRSQGIVLNEPNAVAYTREFDKTLKIFAVGKGAVKMCANIANAANTDHKEPEHGDRTAKTEQAVADQTNTDQSDETEGKESAISLMYPVKESKIFDVNLAGAAFSELFNRVSNQNMVVKRRCLFCVPCSMTAKELNDYKSAVYSANIAEAEFIALAIASAVGLGYNSAEKSVAVSVVIEDGIVEVNAIEGAAIIAGGTVDCEYGKSAVRIRDYKLIADSIYQVIDEVGAESSAPVGISKIYIGGREACNKDLKEFLSSNLNLPFVLNDQSFNSVINGAGKLLEDEKLVARIIKAN